MPENSKIGIVIERDESDILRRWVEHQQKALSRRRDLITDVQLLESSRIALWEIRQALRSGEIVDLTTAAWDGVRAHLQRLSASWATQGFTPSETATFIMSLKQPLFELLVAEHGHDAKGLADDTWQATAFVDQLALYTTEAFQKTREDVVLRQQQELLELSTPVVSLWENILALPIIGTLDSARTQVVMQNLLEAIVHHSAEMAIIDITGVPTVDTLVAQHLLKTVAAARLMGADCIISGIRPQIAQTIIHLGVDLTGVVTKATLADAFQLALRKLGLGITRPGKPGEGA